MSASAKALTAFPPSISAISSITGHTKRHQMQMDGSGAQWYVHLGYPVRHVNSAITVYDRRDRGDLCGFCEQ